MLQAFSYPSINSYDEIKAQYRILLCCTEKTGAQLLKNAKCIPLN